LRNGAIKMYMANDGDLALGHSSPSDKLDVQGADNGITIRSATANRPVLSLINGSSTMLKISANGTYGAIGDGSDANRYMSFRSANVGIGTTNPAAKLHVDGDGGYSWGNGTYTKLGYVSRYDMGGYNTGPSNVSRQLLYYGYDQANWNTQYLKVIVRHSYFYTGGEAAYILDCQQSSARELYNNNAAVGGTPFTFSNNNISGNHRVTSVTFNPGLTYHSYYFTFEWTDGFNPSGQTSTPSVNSISFSY